MFRMASDSTEDNKANLAALLLSSSGMCDNNPLGSVYASSGSGLLTSGIPTRTTPTLTPTTLKNIAESFMDLQSIPAAPEQHYRQAGFVPPVVAPHHHQQRQNQQHQVMMQNHLNQDSSDSNGSFSLQDDSSHPWSSYPSSSCMGSGMSGGPPHASLSPNSNASSTSSSGKGKSGGRRSNKDNRLNPEEEERRRVRRERNKVAAARCRKRRMDHTNSLLEETEGLEDKRQTLQEEIQMLATQKEELEFLLEAHKASCKRNLSHQHATSTAATSTASSSHSRLSSSKDQGSNSVIVNGNSKAPMRPTSLAFGNPSYNNSPGKRGNGQNFSEGNTPGMFNFDSLMDGGSGFTPLANVHSGLTPLTFTSISSSCAGQQQRSDSSISSPDNINPPKLVSL